MIIAIVLHYFSTNPITTDIKIKFGLFCCYKEFNN